MAAVAFLGMYDPPSLHGANDALWQAIARRLRRHGLTDVPDGLDRTLALDDVFADPALLFGQCCGYPLATRHRDNLRYLATPHYAAAGCDGPLYRSRIVARAGDAGETLAGFRGRRGAINQWHSNSGMNVFRGAIAPLAGGAAFFSDVVETGSHLGSLRAVADGSADVAAIDAVTFVHLIREHPDLGASLRTIGWSEASPGLPFVTSVTTPASVVAMLQAVIDEVFADPALQSVRDALLLDGVERLPDGSYDAMLRIERKAERLRYPVLA